LKAVLTPKGESARSAVGATGGESVKLKLLLAVSAARREQAQRKARRKMRIATEFELFTAENKRNLIFTEGNEANEGGRTADLTRKGGGDEDEPIVQVTAWVVATLSFSRRTSSSPAGSGTLSGAESVRDFFPAVGREARSHRPRESIAPIKPCPAAARVYRHDLET
jgi:hypothetical protein